MVDKGFLVLDILQGTGVQFGCEGNGGITSISDTYGGGISDKELFARSGVTEHLNEGEEVMVDKGFLVLDILQGTGVQFGCEGNGGITSITDTYGGGISDKELFARSGVTEHLNEGEEVMVDKGFLVLDILQGTGVKLVRPLFLKNHQFEPGERQEGRKIASHRIVIENVNARVKNFKILHPKVSTNLIPIINEIVYICACLSNFDKPLRK